ncbi:MAG: proline dehydrogenase family protein [Bacteroidota bacterium]
MSFLNTFIARTLPYVPKVIVGQVSKRYIAGESFADAARVVDTLNTRGMMATLDILGEDITEREPALKIRSDWLKVIGEIAGRSLNANISVKPSQLGLKIDPQFCYENTRALVEAAREKGNFVRIDMEDSTTTSATLDMYRKLRGEGFENVGVVIQAYLRRSEADVRALVAIKANIRLCKGIYIEPEEIAFQDREEVRRNFILLLRTMLENGSYAGIATHDDYLVDKSFELIRRLGLGKERYEFQMLLGVREPLRDRIVREGERLRVYVPFGEQWHAYSVRRLKENPEIAGYILKAMFGGNGR